MGMGVDHANGLEERHSRHRQRTRPMAEINVTPFVDVMLVLLIIFMVTAPLMTVDIPVNLPKTSGEAKGPEAPKDPLVITMNAQGHLFVQEAELTASDLVPKLSAIKKTGNVDKIEFRGDESLKYGAVMKMISQIGEAGFQVSLTTLRDEDR